MSVVPSSFLSPGSLDARSTVSDAGEPALVARIRARAGAPPAGVPVGIGDDAAVIEAPRGELDVITTDALVEGVHFRRDWTAARDIGAKAVAVNLSDLAAMGATPRAVLLSLILPATLPLSEFDALIDGVVGEASAAGAALIGGNLARSPGPLVLDITAMGAVGRRRVLRRGGGRPGDELYVTGSVGGAAAGLAILESGADRGTLDEATAACLARYERPVARLRCGRIAGAGRSASACMDLSDGLSDAARQIAEASGTGVTLDAGAIPVTPGAVPWIGRNGGDAVEAALSGGEDYELLFAVSPRRRKAFLAGMRRCRPVPVTLVGRLTRDPGAWLSRAGSLSTLNSGFRHFQA